MDLTLREEPLEDGFTESALGRQHSAVPPYSRVEGCSCVRHQKQGTAPK